MPLTRDKRNVAMLAVLETVAIAFVSAGVVWFVAVHIVAFIKGVREQRKRRR
jgi:hypothetical protein